MGIAALILWLLTAAGGFVLLGTWITKGGMRRGSSHLPVPVVFGHFLLAAAGLLVWIAYLVLGNAVLAWIAFVLLVPVALLGFLMLARWLPTYRNRSEAPPERHFPVVIVGGHGVSAVSTVVLVLLTALGVGGS